MEGGGKGGFFWEVGGMREAIMNMRSSCFPLSALELTIQLFVEYIECHAILMTPQHAQISLSPRFLFSTKHSYLSPL